MDSSSISLKSFFESWEANMSSGDIPAVVANFADVFLYAHPRGTLSVRASDFALALPKRKHLFDSLRCQPTILVSLTETKLDNCFTMTRAQWRMTFAKDDASPQEVLVDSTYVVSTGGGDYKIVFYLAHQDIMEILKERGILPTQTTSC